MGVILDGNRRWAADNGVSLLEAYRRGAEKVGELLEWCAEENIPHVTLWAMSADNLCRPEAEIAPLLRVITEGLAKLAAERRWRLRPIGELGLLPAWAQAELDTVTQATAMVDGVSANIAIAYGGRMEIISALRGLLTECASEGYADLDGLFTEDRLARHLYTAHQPDIDLVIRTSGERRLSGFLPWQTAQSELVFCSRNWPDFTRHDFLDALGDFSLRTRRFGL